MKLSQIKPKTKCVVDSIDSSMPMPFRRRLCELGLCHGAKISVLKISGQKKSLLLSFNGLTVTMQKVYAHLINVRQ